MSQFFYDSGILENFMFMLSVIFMFMLSMSMRFYHFAFHDAKMQKFIEIEVENYKKSIKN